MCGSGVDFDFRGQVRFRKRLFEGGLVVGGALVVVVRDRNEELRLGLRGLQVRTVGRIGDESAAME